MGIGRQLLEGKAALVTGASSGIGAAIARAMAAAGADVAVHYHTNRKGGEATAEAVRAAGRRSLCLGADLGDASEVGRLFEELGRAWGRLDILVNNAGLTMKKAFLEVEEGEWDRVLSSNLKSVFLCSRRAAVLMGRGGAILNVSSIHAAMTTSLFSVYAASKGGMEALTRGMAIELARRGIRVNAVRPGWIQVERDRVEPEDPLYAKAAARVPLGRAGETADVAPLAVFLCSAEASYITGQVVPVEGGHGVVLNTSDPLGFGSGSA
jgi:NAD(P)-dependent dehydrogenase (short-subunit alcohol dehydrogenase family)